MKLSTELPMLIVGIERLSTYGGDKWLLVLSVGRYDGPNKTCPTESGYMSNRREFKVPLEGVQEARLFGARIGEWI